VTEVSAPRRTVLLRGLRARCPACGVGAVFVRAFAMAGSCGGCGFTFERGPGHWVGGNEINLLVTYPTAVVALAVPAFLWGGSWITATAGGLLAVAIGLLVHRPARGLFFAIDYLVEPQWSAEDGDGRGGGDARPRDGRPGGGGRARPLSLPVAEPVRRLDAEPLAPVVPLAPSRR
jgi:uncharacterized protein (DUF983 family)